VDCIVHTADYGQKYVSGVKFYAKIFVPA